MKKKLKIIFQYLKILLKNKMIKKKLKYINLTIRDINNNNLLNYLSKLLKIQQI